MTVLCVGPIVRELCRLGTSGFHGREGRIGDVDMAGVRVWRGFGIVRRVCGEEEAI